MPMLFRVLGPLEVEVDGVPGTPPGRGPRALLTALLLRPNKVVPAYALARSIWGEELPGQVDKALHQVVARVRRALGAHSAAVVTRPPGYLLAVDESAIDAARFEARYRAAQSTEDAATAVVLLQEALALWRGPAYGEFADDFARPAATRLEELRLVALEDQAALLIACGAPAQAVAHASDLAAAYPLRERPIEGLMRALHAVGRSGEALTVFQRHRKHLADELGIDPSTGLRDLESQILRDDLGAPVRGGDRHVVRPRANVPTLPWRTPALFGRDEELRLLAESLATRRLVTVVGPGGVGKTRLMIEAGHQHVRRGGTACGPISPLSSRSGWSTR